MCGGQNRAYANEFYKILRKPESNFGITGLNPEVMLTC